MVGTSTVPVPADPRGRRLRATAAHLPTCSRGVHDTSTETERPGAIQPRPAPSAQYHRPGGGNLPPEGSATGRPPGPAKAVTGSGAVAAPRRAAPLRRVDSGFGIGCAG